MDHAPGLPAPWIDFTFSFHVPLFVMLSGLLLEGDRFRMSLVPTARRFSRSLLVPYAFFFLIAYVYWLIAKRHGTRSVEMEAVSWWDPVRGFLIGNGDGLYVDAPLWFFPCLFVASLLLHAIRSRSTAAGAAALTAVLAVSFITLHETSQPRWIASADCAVVATFFLALGSWLGPSLIRRSITTRPAVLILLGMMSGAGCWALGRTMGHVDLNILAFGNETWRYLPSAVLGCLAVLCLAAAMPSSRPAVWLSKNTLVIFPLHFLFFSVVTGVGLVVFRLDTSFKEQAGMSFVFIGFALLASWVAAKVLRRYVPWVLDARCPLPLIGR